MLVSLRSVTFDHPGTGTNESSCKVIANQGFHDNAQLSGLHASLECCAEISKGLKAEAWGRAVRQHAQHLVMDTAAPLLHSYYELQYGDSWPCLAAPASC
jgi:hypothetical protein